MSISLSVRVLALAAGLVIPLAIGLPAAADPNPCNPCAAKAANPCNPCAAKAANPCNPCAKNPCAKNRANPCNPCGAKGMNPCNPCGAKGMNPCNPCGAKGMNPCNPCGASGSVDPDRFRRPEGLRMGGGDPERLLARGEELWNDSSLSTNGVACATCHVNYGSFLPTFAKPYPHRVSMVESMSGVERIDAAEMVQFCMIQPMQAEPLSWSSRELAALTAYVEHLQDGFEPNPCAMKSANPCNPCGAKGMNPCNPCSR